MRSRWRDERGVTLVLMVLVMALILGMAALTIDYGMVKSEKAEAQRTVDETNTATCVKPVAVPDLWNNRPHIVKGKEAEDLNGNHALDYSDKNGNNVWNEGETEQWTFDAGLGDTYAPTSDGYGTTARDA